MPNIDPVAKAWESDWSGRIGKAVFERRKELKLTAVELSERTKSLGYHITRVAITKIETNARAGKFDVTELFILAAALDVVPGDLLFPGDELDEPVELLPGQPMTSLQARSWFDANPKFDQLMRAITGAPKPGKKWAYGAVVHKREDK